MPRGTTKRRPRTTAALLGAALEVFAERGFHAATIEQICERAGYTRGAFYSNFKTKEELFFALFDAHSERVVTSLKALVEEVGSDAPALGRFAELLSRIEPGERAWYLVSTEFTLYAIRHPEAARVLAEHDARLRAEISRLLVDVLHRAGRSVDVDPDQLARLLVAMREGGLAQSYVEPDRLPPGELERRFLPTLLLGVSTERGGDT
ncbi:TetR/AcrR family transcriptional regulator [Streptomyces sp. GC420]|uniref:TetR/AcrR family transcriptional regulator n=1 Tax=Streptomyces sp. GC420 TaxID=2697568 RepID=UPI0014150B40|nr:TetR/AcrR family transcriptional regulator [Streptomyces sp. GC420]NBM17991.1 TetR family transcriptional regulator [Streptomyces sp. GC420]